MKGLVKRTESKAQAARKAPVRAAKAKSAVKATRPAKRAVRATAVSRASEAVTATRKSTARTIAAVKKPASRAVTARKLAAKTTAPKRAAATPAQRVASKPRAARPPAAREAAVKPAARHGLAGPAKPAAAPRRADPRARIVAPPPTAVPEIQPPAQPPAIDMVARDKELAREHSATAVNRALSLLETLARTGPVPLAVLADAAGCGKTAALQLLTTMQARNFVIQDVSHSLWQLGARWAVLGSAASEQGALAATAMPFLAALGNATGENVYLRVREGMECETVAIYQTDPGLRVYTEVGKKMPLHAGSGRVLLAHAPEAVQTQVLAQRLQRYTPSTRIDPSWIAADLHRIRTRGFLITDSEVVAGTVSVCAAVRDASGQVVAAILIGAPSLRMRPPRPRALMPLVVEAARKLSYALGSISEQPEAAPADEPMIEQRRMGTFAGPAWPAQALGAAISRPHSIFR
jgi:DNA-binding IclR family transcriptional regulator